METDYYKILGIAPTATSDEIKKAYRKLAMKYHPDRNQGDKKAEEKFKNAAEAYEVLGDVEKRKIYDRYGVDGLKNSGYSGPGNFEDIFSSFGDIFGDLFGLGGRQSAGRGQHAPVHGSDLRYDLTIPFMEAVHGIAKEIEIKRPITCWTCEGSGLRPGYKAQTCASCQGKGQVIHAQGFFRVQTTCSRCRGEGSIITDPCNDCNGTGLVNKSKKVSLKIPAGINTGAQMRLRNEGEGGRRGGQPGDLYVVIHVEPHEYFERHGNDIHCKLTLSVVQAAMGCSLDTPTIHGEKTVNIPAATQTGQTFTLKSEGIPSLRSKRRGNMSLEAYVKTPENLTKRQKELLTEFNEIETDKSEHHEAGFFKKLFHMAK